MKRAVVLLSGGLDSTTCMAAAHNEGCELYPVSFDYGQRHIRELECAGRIAEYYKAKAHKVFKIAYVEGNALTDGSVDVPDYAGDGNIPATYVPARNILFLSYAAGYAESVQADYIYIGVSAVDYSGYPDCRPEFIEAFQRVLDIGTKRGVEGPRLEIVTPIINLSKAGTIVLGSDLGAPYHLTTSCYRGGEKACGVCDSCVLRLKGFKGAGLPDPIEYK